MLRINTTCVYWHQLLMECYSLSHTFTRRHLDTHTHEQQPDSSHRNVCYICRRKKKQKNMSYKYFWKRSHICTHLVIQLSRAEGEFNVIVITRQFLSCHLYRGGWGGRFMMQVRGNKNRLNTQHLQINSERMRCVCVTGFCVCAYLYLAVLVGTF